MLNLMGQGTWYNRRYYNSSSDDEQCDEEHKFKQLTKKEWDDKKSSYSGDLNMSREDDASIVIE